MNSARKILVLLAIAVALVAVQTGQAQATETVTVAGVVYAVSVADSTIQVDVGGGTITTVYCIPFNRLAKKSSIVLKVGDEVSIEVYDRTFSDGTTKLVAVSLTADNEAGQEVTVTLR